MPSRQWGKALFALVLVTAIGFLLDRGLFAEGVPRWEVVLLSDLVTGALAAALVLVLSERAAQRERLVNARLQVIAEMNHHIRNALQVIQFHSAANPANEAAARQVKESIERIQWALREILPTLPEE